jgi:hypothetical protein
MGTPHRGGNGVMFGQALVRLAKGFMNADDRLLKHLERDSELLQDQLEQFSTISLEFVIKFAYETRPTPTPFGNMMVMSPQ